MTKKSRLDRMRANPAADWTIEDGAMPRAWHPVRAARRRRIALEGVRLTLSFMDATSRFFEAYEPVKTSGEDLAQYSGEYSSAEVEATYRLAVKDGKLMLSLNWQEPFVLEPTVRDEFQGRFGTALVFRRDVAGHITGFDAFAGRVRNIFFARIAG